MFLGPSEELEGRLVSIIVTDKEDVHPQSESQNEDRGQWP